MADATLLGSKVRVLRRRHGLTQTALAEKLGISGSNLNLIEHNRRPLSAPLLIKVAETHRSYEVRKQAMFWLGQSQDARALAFFEDVLKR